MGSHVTKYIFSNSAQRYCPNCPNHLKIFTINWGHQDDPDDHENQALSYMIH